MGVPFWRSPTCCTAQESQNPHGRINSKVTTKNSNGVLRFGDRDVFSSTGKSKFSPVKQFKIQNANGVVQSGDLDVGSNEECL